MTLARACRGRAPLVVPALVAVLALGMTGLSVAAPPAAPAPELVPVAAGSFVQGSDDAESGSLDDEVAHPVRITRPFLLGRTEVTQTLWAAVMGRNPSYYAACPTCPVDNVSWDDAVAFCNRLSARDGFAPAYAVADSQVTWDPRADGYRLPTEAEWEYACRAGTTTTFATGPCLGADEANVDGHAPLSGCPDGLDRAEPEPVGSFPANAWGLHDMHGNVSEWCWDRYGPYPASDRPLADPTGPTVGRLRVTRGGSWANGAARCRCAQRQPQPPRARYDMIGLRLARTPAGPP